MGAVQFSEKTTIPKKTTTEAAFRDLTGQAKHEYGHGGYTGTLAEKGSFTLLHTAKSEANAKRLMEAYMHGDPIPVLSEEARAAIDDKWGPAGAIRFPIDTETDGVFFFGWASY